MQVDVLVVFSSVHRISVTALPYYSVLLTIRRKIAANAKVWPHPQLIKVQLKIIMINRKLLNLTSCTADFCSISLSLLMLFNK